MGTEATKHPLPARQRQRTFPSSGEARSTASAGVNAGQQVREDFPPTNWKWAKRPDDIRHGVDYFQQTLNQISGSEISSAALCRGADGGVALVALV